MGNLIEKSRPSILRGNLHPQILTKAPAAPGIGSRNEPQKVSGQVDKINGASMEKICLKPRTLSPNSSLHLEPVIMNYILEIRGARGEPETATSPKYNA
jgi:hypothetical protein